MFLLWMHLKLKPARAAVCLSGCDGEKWCLLRLSTMPMVISFEGPAPEEVILGQFSIKV